jgi:hypothetical protein
VLCGCDGPPHQYDPSWCIRPRFLDGGHLPAPQVQVVGYEGNDVILRVTTPIPPRC